MDLRDGLEKLFTLQGAVHESQWPEVDDLPQADVSDLARAAQYQSTIDQDFES